jgi:hypothetical protein
MNKGRFVGGIICLALAVLLGVLSVTLSADKFMFIVGEENMPWVPPVVLGIVGIVLLASAGIGGQKAESQVARKEIVLDPEKAALNKRLETIGWGCFLIMLGGFMFVPHEIIARGYWSIGVGIIMLGLNAARYFNGIRMSGFTTFLGVISLIGGVLQLVGLEEIESAFLFIILGLALLGRPWFDKLQLFGKAGEA